MERTRRLILPALGPLLVIAACGSTPPPPGPAPSRPASAQGPGPAEAARPPHTAADVGFMRRMIVHHGQALEMTALVAGRTENEAIRLLAERIEVSQRDEIALMEAWLRQHGEAVPAGGAAAHATRGGEAMPGMLGAEELARLAEARGAEFDRLFLELMILHHEGALVMVGELFAEPGAGQDPEVFRLAMDVDADQRAEIRRLRAMLER